MKKDNKKGWLSMEMVTALAILTIAVIPIFSLSARNIVYSRHLRCKSIITEMLNDRIVILRQGGWKEYGFCEKKKIDFIGKASEGLPEGNLYLSIEKFKREKNLLKISLWWQPKNPRSLKKITKETLVFSPSIEKEMKYD